MMNSPAIVITSAFARSEKPVPLETGIKARRSFCVRQLRKISKGTPPTVLLPQQESTGQAPGNVRRSRSASPSSPKRKELTSPLALKRKFLRQVKLPPLPQISISKGRKEAPSEATTVTTPSSCEEELADQENQSPNDPEFVRRASERWRRRTGAVQLQPPLQLLLQGSGSLQPTFQWPTNPSQQPAVQRRFSPRSIHYPQSPFSSVPTSPILGPSPFRRCNTQYSSLNTASTESTFKRCSRSYSSFGSFNRPRVTVGVCDLSSSRSSRRGRLMVRAGRSVSPSSRNVEGKTQTLPERLALDDTVAEEVKKAARKERLLANPDQSSLTAPFRRLSARIRKSFRGSKNVSISNKGSDSKKNTSSSSSTYNNSTSSNSISSSSSYCSNDNTPMDSASSFTSSTSYQSFLSSSSGYSSDCSSSPSSPAIVPRRLSTPPIAHSAVAATILAAGRLTFQDIFLDEPQIAEKFAIMFPTEPRPEWHRHLRQVINKAGQKIFKKGEPHETTIPENLRHQLKHIYVY
ncbi:uncharacterized protein LOC135111674 [Scylla paramamosain]|uniref:uncharacterized protein LOC135111674 n=1 Tax=Scylla paramamosain TaxID=85552 RepID=UPI003082AE05